MEQGDVLAVHVRAGGGGSEESEQQQRDVQRRDSRSVERASGRLGGRGVARNLGEDGGRVLVCDYFIHDSSTVCARDKRYRRTGTGGEVHGSVAVANRDFEQAEASEYCERNTFGRVTISVK